MPKKLTRELLDSLDGGLYDIFSEVSEDVSQILHFGPCNWGLKPNGRKTHAKPSIDYK